MSPFGCFRPVPNVPIDGLTQTTERSNTRGHFRRDVRTDRMTRGERSWRSRSSGRTLISGLRMRATYLAANRLVREARFGRELLFRDLVAITDLWQCFRPSV